MRFVSDCGNGGDLMAASYGFIYFLSNQSMDGIVKVGHTTKHPRLRAAEISSATGCPKPFDVLAYFGCWEPHRVELEIHRELDLVRVNQAREFFKIDYLRIGQLIDHYIDGESDAVWRHILDGLIAFDDYEAANK